MSFYIQHGYGKGDKLQQVASGGAVDGVLLSPADEDLATLRQTVAVVRDLGGVPLLDPQTYIYSTNPEGIGRKHADHGLDIGRVHWAQDSRGVDDVISRVYNANRALGINEKFIAPTCIQSSFVDVWTPLAIQYAKKASAEWGAERTYATLCIEESALSQWSAIEDWLDVATQLDVRGFYLLIDRRRGNYPGQVWDASRLRNLLRLIYTLSQVNKYEVIWGYSDLDGLLGIAAGANAAASGWSYTLRNFSAAKWQPTAGGGGGKPAVARLYVPKLWTPVRLIDEGSAIFDTSVKDEVIPQWARARFDSEGFEAWSNREGQTNHLSTLSRVANQITRRGTVSHRCDAVLKSLDDALEHFSQISNEGATLAPTYRAKVSAYSEALQLFMTDEGL